MSARSRRALANLEKRIQKFIDTAFFWPVEVGEIVKNRDFHEIFSLNFFFLAQAVEEAPRKVLSIFYVFHCKTAT